MSDLAMILCVVIGFLVATNVVVLVLWLRMHRLYWSLRDALNFREFKVYSGGIHKRDVQ